MPGDFLLGEKDAFDFFQKAFHQVKPQISQKKEEKKQKKNRSGLLEQREDGHFVAKRWRKKSVKAASSFSWDT